mgnify:CR=1 FL=1
MIISFTGHRPIKLGGYKLPNTIKDKIQSYLVEIIGKLQPDKAISGMALGVDQWAAETCINLSLPFVAAVPFIGQDQVWPPESQIIYRQLSAQACEKVIVCEGGYSAEKMQIRNEWLVDICDILLAVFNQSETSGGTFNCISYASSIDKKIIIIDPSLL